MIENNIEIKIVGSREDFDDMAAVREQVFIKEQRIPREKEFDGNDFSATHILVRINGKPAGTMRIRYFAGFVKFERMSVLKEYRKSDIADKIMNKGFDFVKKKGYRHVYGVCKQELLERWRQCGYYPINGAPKVEQNGMVLIPIMRDLEEDPQAVKMTDHPKVLNAKEDNWFEDDDDRYMEQVHAVFLQRTKSNIERG